jgi:hypothetical protein
MELMYSSAHFSSRQKMKGAVNFALQPLYQRIGGWVGTKAGLDAMEKKKISCPRCESATRVE